MIRFYSDKKSLFVYLYFLISILEIGAEYFENSTVIWLTKPLILPILLLYYLQRTSKWALFYTLALGVNWLANIAFILKSEWTTFCALLLFVLHRVFVLLQVAKFERKRGIGLLPVLFGSAPFMILFLSVINLSFEAIVVPDLYILLLQSVLMSIFGGFSFASFYIVGDKASKMLFMSSLYFALNLFVLGVKMYYLDLHIMKPLSMLLFIFAHFFLVKYILYIEKEIKN
ncbi:hypothetical protein [Flavobacterium stagni]|uniref:YhhN-like protein n=1 Tax=Flavobacterium stagni TaxID=2506421 RepID=A0A4Q1K448_9FLAO|nr:hypothetical protein [Flavobacterium stagni]RXR20312.1 hypothetical protein EQG61_12900 [Flavobacterium stagni]